MHYKKCHVKLISAKRLSRANDCYQLKKNWLFLKLSECNPMKFENEDWNINGENLKLQSSSSLHEEYLWIDG